MPFALPYREGGMGTRDTTASEETGKGETTSIWDKWKASWEDQCCEAPWGSLLFQPRWGKLYGRSFWAEAWRFQRVPHLIYLAELELLWKGIGRMLFPHSS